MWHQHEPFPQGQVPQQHQFHQLFQQNGGCAASASASAQILQSSAIQTIKQENITIEELGIMQQQQQQQLQQQQLQQQQQQQDLIDQQQPVVGTAMMDVVANSSNPRASRNMAEKQRRDNLNTQIQTMATLVPTVSSGGSRKKDKISVLRLSAAHLRIAYTLGVSSNKFLPRRFNEIDLESCLIDSLAGSSCFLLLLTTTGKIIYVSKHVETHLGHEQIELIGDSIYNYIYQDDHEEVTKGLTPDEPLLALTNFESNGNDSSISTEVSIPHDGSFKEQRRNFNFRMSQRTNSRRENVHYEYVQCSGVLRPANEIRNQDPSSSHFRPRESVTTNDIIFVGTARLLKKRTITQLSLIEANKNEYFTRHLVDGRIIFCDHRISVVSGYMSEEVSGTSAFKFMHKDDVRWTIIALRHMYDEGKNYGSSCYRLITKTGDFIYLRTHGYLEYDESTQSVGSFICINTLMSKEEGERLNREMKRRFSATVSSTVKAIRGSDEPEKASSSQSGGKEETEDLSLLQDAITHLISDLPSPNMSTEERETETLPDAQFVKAAIYSQKLPPAAVQASKIGIKDIENGLPHVGKGKNNSRKGGDEHKNNKKNGDWKNSIAEKRIIDSEESMSPPPVNTTVSDKDNSEKNLNGTDITEGSESIREVDMSSNPPNSSVVSSSSQISSQPSTLQQALQRPLRTSKVSTQKSFRNNQPDNSLIQQNSPNYEAVEKLPNYQSQKSLKRPHNDIDNSIVNCKRRAPGNTVVPEISDTEDTLCQKNGLDYENFLEVPPITLDSNILEIQESYQLHSDPTNSNSGDQFINFQDIPCDQLITSGLDNSQDFMKIFNLPSIPNFESETADLLQFSTSDQEIVENVIGRTHLQMPDSMSSCESQFSDLDESILQSHRESFTAEAKSDHKIQNQKLKTLQPSCHKMPLKAKHNIGV